MLYGETAGRLVATRIHAPVADEAELGTIPSSDVADLMLVNVGGAIWYWDADSVAAAAAGSVVEAVDQPAAGRFRVLLSAATSSAAGLMSAADKTKLAAIQTFDATLVAGTITKNTDIVVTASTRVVGIVPTARGGTFPAGGFESLTASNVVGAAGVGAVTITARKADGTLENACTDTVSVILAG